MSINPTTIPNTEPTHPALDLDDPGNAAAFREALGLTGQAKPPLHTIAVLGDSHANGTNMEADDVNNATLGSFLWPLMAQAGGSIRLVTRGPGGKDFNQGGATAAGIRDNLMPLVVAASPDVCVVNAGGNSLAAAVAANPGDPASAAESVFADVAGIIAGLTAAGIVPVLTTEPPRLTIPTTEYYQAHVGLNELFLARGGGMGAVVCDWWAACAADPLDHYSLALPGVMSDETHQNLVGRQRLGVSLARRIRQAFDFPREPSAPPAADSPVWASDDPYLTSASDGLTLGADEGVTNDAEFLPGGGVRASISGLPPGGVIAGAVISTKTERTDDAFDNGAFRAVFDLEFDPSDFHFWGMSALGASFHLAPGPGQIGAGYMGMYPASAALRGIGEVMAFMPGRLVFETPVFRLPISGPAGTDRRQVRATLRLYGSGSVTVRTLGVVRAGE